MKKHGLLAVLVAVMGGLFYTPTTSAVSLKVAPLSYETTIKKGEKQKGFIDVSNPTAQKVVVTTSVQAFEQTDNSGTLKFKDNEQLSAGVSLDLDEFELGPREAVRMYFVLDSQKLPPGDVFGAIFFSTKPVKASTGVGEAVRLGTLLSIVNGAPGARSADITDLNVPFLHFDNVVQGTYTIRNTADPKTATGFYPTVTIKSFPFGQTEQKKGKLVFAGRSRENAFETKAPPLGVYKISTEYGASSKSRYVLVVTPLAALILLLGVAVIWVAFKSVRRYRKGRFGFGNKW